MSKKNTFTLVELIVVIGVIFILVGIAVPAYMIAMKRARKAQARVQIKELQTAITAYKNEYGYLPFYPANGGYNDVLINVDPVNTATASPYNDLISTLRGTNANLNPNQIAFMSRSGSTYVDPWGKEFFVALDMKGDGEISDASGVNTTQKIYGKGAVPADVVIWSMGADQAHSSTDGDDSNKDNVNSWKN